MICYIGVGSNIGNRSAYITKAIALLKKVEKIAIKKVSPVYETKPQGGPRGQGDYLNLVLKLECGLGPRRLLKVLKQIEKAAGRKPRKKRWAAREIDLDILLFGNRVISEKGLIIPHPRLAERDFVLKPLLDVTRTQS